MAMYRDVHQREEHASLSIKDQTKGLGVVQTDGVPYPCSMREAWRWRCSTRHVIRSHVTPLKMIKFEGQPFQTPPQTNSRTLDIPPEVQCALPAFACRKLMAASPSGCAFLNFG